LIYPLLDFEVDGEGVLAGAQGPAMNVMDVFDAGNTLKLLLNDVDFDIIRRALHQHLDALPEGDPCRVEHNACKEQRADGVQVPQVWIPIDQRRCDDNSDRIKNISQNVKIGCLDIQVALLFLGGNASRGVFSDDGAD
jgi:hypothetical protein